MFKVDNKILFAENNDIKILKTVLLLKCQHCDKLLVRPANCTGTTYAN